MGGRILIIGIGNAYRRDDGAGLSLGRAIQALAPELEYREQSGEGAALMQAWEGVDTVILCDAISSGAAPGAIHRLDASDEPLPPDLRPFSTHAFGVAQAVELSRKLGTLPRRTILYGIEGGDFSGGEGLSAAVEASLAEAARRAARDARAVAGR